MQIRRLIPKACGDRLSDQGCVAHEV